MKPNLQPVQDLRDGFTAETGMETQSGKAADLNPVDSLAACQIVIKPDKRDLRTACLLKPTHRQRQTWHKSGPMLRFGVMPPSPMTVSGSGKSAHSSPRSGFSKQGRAHFARSTALLRQGKAGQKMGQIDEAAWHDVLLEMLA